MDVLIAAPQELFPVADVAAIVRDLLEHGPEWRADTREREAHPTRLALDPHLCAALDTVRVRLAAGGLAALGVLPMGTW